MTRRAVKLEIVRHKALQSAFKMPLFQNLPLDMYININVSLNASLQDGFYCNRMWLSIIDIYVCVRLLQKKRIAQNTVKPTQKESANIFFIK